MYLGGKLAPGTDDFRVHARSIAEAAHEVFEAMPEANPRRLTRLDESWAIEEARLGLPVRPSWGLYNALDPLVDARAATGGCAVLLVD